MAHKLLQKSLETQGPKPELGFQFMSGLTGSPPKNFYLIRGGSDESTCTKCKNMDGKIFAISEAKLKENYPPFHKHCRCKAIGSQI